MRWQWHQLYHMQIICTSIHTHNHAISQFLQAGCFSWRPTNSVKTLRTKHLISHYLEKQLDDLHMANFVQPAMQQCRLVKVSYLHRQHQSIRNSPQHNLRFMKVHQTHHMKVQLHSSQCTHRYKKIRQTHRNVLLGLFLFLAFHCSFFHFHLGQLLVFQLLDKLVEETAESVDTDDGRKWNVETPITSTHVQHVSKHRHQVTVLVLSTALHQTQHDNWHTQLKQICGK